jgi:Mrp family chromosome partitioning ATPase
VGAFTIGVTAARFEACKRGLAANYAAVLARREERSVCVVDADGRSCDVGTRLAVRGLTLQRFALPRLANEDTFLSTKALARMAYPHLTVVPVEPSFLDLGFRQAYDATLDAVVRDFDIIVIDQPVGAGRPGPTLDGKMVDRLDVLLVACTPDRSAVAATLRHIELFEEAKERGAVAPHVELYVVMTGDEGSTLLDPLDVAELLGEPLIGHVPQLWGRALPNFGFGPTLGVMFLEAEIERVHAIVSHANRYARARI